jgi:DNA-binding NtrC family response regulator
MTKTILVVDDDPAVLQSYGRLLRRLGHRILLSEDSEMVRTDPDALREIDLLILDQRMPRTSGLALLASLHGRGDQGRVRPAVILISAVPSRELRTEAARLGVVEVLEKPVDVTHLLATVRAALGGAAQETMADPPTAARR